MTPTLAHETNFYATVINAARIAGWRTAHFRPAWTRRGWRTAVQGDGKGFPTSSSSTPSAGSGSSSSSSNRARLSVEQEEWGQALLAAGALFRLVHVPSGIDTFCQDLINTVRPL